MAERIGWPLALALTAGLCVGCSSSSSSGTHSSDQGTDSDAGDAASDGDDAPGDDEEATDDGATPMDAAAPVRSCDAGSLAVAPGAPAASCFQCQSARCAVEVAACATDCVCGPAYACLERSSMASGINSGYSVCPAAVEALMNGSATLMDLASCAELKCDAECFGGDD